MPGKNSGEITKIAIQKKVIMRMKWLFHELKFFELAKLTIIYQNLIDIKHYFLIWDFVLL